MRDSMSVVVLISGRGSNLEAILNAGVPVAAVISNEAGVRGLQLAESHGVTSRVVTHAVMRRAKRSTPRSRRRIDRLRRS
jgi:folate-dependent phosphoribosylglycinamide formyltransferase PurN